MGNRTLKNLAVNAKNRLIQKSGNVVSKMPSTTIAKFKLITNEDDAFVEKVKNLLEENSICPIKELMDKKKYDEMSFFSKQKYLLDTLDKFKEIKNQIESENERQIVY